MLKKKTKSKIFMAGFYKNFFWFWYLCIGKIKMYIRMAEQSIKLFRKLFFGYNFHCSSINHDFHTYLIIDLHSSMVTGKNYTLLCYFNWYSRFTVSLVTRLLVSSSWHDHIFDASFHSWISIWQFFRMYWTSSLLAQNCPMLCWT